jgi:hypothetical protein
VKHKRCFLELMSPCPYSNSTRRIIFLEKNNDVGNAERS